MTKKKSINRRHFIKQLIGAGMVGATSPFAFTGQAQAALPAFSDYKALVCIFLMGGNDSFNMLIPSDTTVNKGYSDYAAIRGDLAVANNALDLSSIALGGKNLNQENLGKGANNPYNVNLKEETSYLRGLYPLSDKGIDLGVNAIMPELAQLITDNKASILANIGTLVRPVTRDQIQARKADLPLFLFSHNHQQRILQTGQANNLNDIGWAGKIADQWYGINNASRLGLNISYADNARMLIGNKSKSLVLEPNIPLNFNTMVKGKSASADDRIAIFKALMGLENTSSTGNLNFSVENTFQTHDDFQRLYAEGLNKSLNVFEPLSNVWNANPISYSSTGSYGESLFAKPSQADLGFNTELKGKLFPQLEAVAKMIDLSAKGKFQGGAFNRQIFYVTLGGFDTHSAQISEHPLLLRELSLGLWKFQKALEERDLANNVTTFTMSDFGRSLKINGDGTDHAWGAHHIVMGGDGNNSSGHLQGGQMIGTLPDISLKGADDHDKRGRIIPSLAQDQLNASLCHWFGVDQQTISSIFTNLANFESDTGVVQSAYLNDLFVV